MKVVHAQRSPRWFRPILLMAVATGFTGCGLKGDLYLEEPDAEPSQTAAPGAEAGATEAPDITSGLVNTEAALDAGPGSSIIEPGDVNNLERPGETATGQDSSAAATGTDPDSVTTIPAAQGELEERDAKTKTDSDNTASRTSESNAAPGMTDTKTDITAPVPAKEQPQTPAQAQ